jgi:hypothetical protein
VPTYRPGDIRKIGNGEVVTAYRNPGAILAQTTDVSRRTESAQLQADIAAVRAGTARSDPAGYLTERLDELPAGNTNRPAPYS